MNEDNDTVEYDSYLEFYKSNNIVEQTPKPHSSRQDIYMDPLGDFESPGNLTKEQEPLFVEDRTNNFRLRYAIQYENPTSNQSKKNQTRPRQYSCWNCSSTNHSLHDCPEQRNHRLINQNRQMFLMQKQQQYSGNKNVRNRNGGQRNMRYFMSNCNLPFSNFTPGKMSDELIEALGLPKNGIPAHVYNMREHGYPGGWLDDARKEYSGISIFTAPNECIPLPGKENGENDIMCYNNIDEKKLHIYPGFNAPNPPDVLDEYKKYGCPEFNPEQDLKNMLEIIKLNKIDTKLTKGESCHKEDNTGIASNSNETLTIVDNVHFKVVEEVKPPSSPEDGEITDDDDIIIEDKNSVKSPSSDTKLEESVNDQSISDSFVTCIDTKELEDSTLSSVSDSTISPSVEPSLTQSSLKRKFGDVKTEVLGTPVLKRFSSYENRPTLANFAKGMVDMVDHENLPNSVGTFKKIKEILKDVRQTVNNLL